MEKNCMKLLRGIKINNTKYPTMLTTACVTKRNVVKEGFLILLMKRKPKKVNVSQA